MGLAFTWNFTQIYQNHKESRPYDEEDGHSPDYLALYLTYYILMMLSILTFKTVPYGKLAVALLQTAYLLILIKKKYYLLQFHNASLIFNQISLLLFTIYLIIIDFLDLEGLIHTYVVFAFLALLASVNILGFVRLAVHYKKIMSRLHR